MNTFKQDVCKEYLDAHFPLKTNHLVICWKQEQKKHKMQKIHMICNKLLLALY